MPASVGNGGKFKDAVDTPPPRPTVGELLQASPDSTGLIPVFQEEQASHVRAYTDFLALGIHRSIPKLVAYYRSLVDRGLESQVPSDNFGVLKTWCVKFKWLQRAAEFERRIAEQAEIQLVTDRVALKKDRLEADQKLKSLGNRLLDKFLERIDEMDEKSIQTLAYLLPTAIRAIELAHKEERTDLGEDAPSNSAPIEMVMDALQKSLPPQLYEIVKTNLAALTTGASLPPPLPVEHLVQQSQETSP